MKYVSKDSFQSKVFVYVGISVFVCIGILDFFSIMPLKFSSGEEKFIFYPCVQLLKYLVCRKTLLTINLRLLCPHLRERLSPHPAPHKNAPPHASLIKKGFQKGSDCNLAQTPHGTVWTDNHRSDTPHFIDSNLIGNPSWSFPFSACFLAMIISLQWIIRRV